MRNIVLAVAGIVLVLILVARFGMDFLINFSLLVRRSGANDSSNAKQDLAYIAPPVIDPLSEATKSATINVTGYAGDKQSVKLYVNDKEVDKTTVNDNKQFTFSNISLKKGINEIKLKAVTENNKESEYSPITKVIYMDNPPHLDISSPQDGQGVSKDSSPVKVTGKTDPNVQVTINGFWAIAKDDGSFYYMLTLQDGDNDIKAVATDDAGNQTTKELHIHTN